MTAEQLLALMRQLADLRLTVERQSDELAQLREQLAAKTTKSRTKGATA